MPISFNTIYRDRMVTTVSVNHVRDCTRSVSVHDFRDVAQPRVAGVGEVPLIFAAGGAMLAIHLLLHTLTRSSRAGMAELPDPRKPGRRLSIDSPSFPPMAGNHLT